MKFVLYVKFYSIFINFVFILHDKETHVRLVNMLVILSFFVLKIR